MKKATTPDVGVICGRFQVPSLHEGHLDLFQQVADRHKKVREEDAKENLLEVVFENGNLLKSAVFPEIRERAELR